MTSADPVRNEARRDPDGSGAFVLSPCECIDSDAWVCFRGQNIVGMNECPCHCHVTPYYEEPGITIYRADCRAVLPHLPAVDPVLTDPPYGLNLGDHVAAKEERYADHLVKGRYASYEDTVENLRAIVVPAVKLAIAKATRSIVFCAGNRIIEYPGADAVGGIFYPSAVGRNCWGFNSCALALFYGAGCHIECGSKATMIASARKAEKNGHPCPKPIGAIRHFVAMGSEPGDLILDPFMGSGTTLVAAKALGRRAIGIEIEQRYCDIAIERLRQEQLPFDEPATPEPEQLTLCE